jgi:tRNA-splicing ligase RtcB
LDNGDVLHRKGATPADKGQIGIIPANMRDGTYITIGLGNEEYLSSASHGAGRTMSRTDARKATSLETFERQMEGIVATVNKHTLDESPDSYKDIKMVMEAQEGKVIETLYHCPPIIVVKGDKKARR